MFVFMLSLSPPSFTYWWEARIFYVGDVSSINTQRLFIGLQLFVSLKLSPQGSQAHHVDALPMLRRLRASF